MKWFSDKGWLYLTVGALLVAAMVRGAKAECPHCCAGDPFYDSTRQDHVIRTEAGCGVTKCLAVDGEGVK